MTKRILFQTVEDKGNPDYVLRNGPFQSRRRPWLGNGYYFWDTSIRFAHWWGDKGYGGHYMITRVDCEFDQEKVFDLLGNVEHIEMFERSYDALLEALGSDDITVDNVLNFIRRRFDFPYIAIRTKSDKTFRVEEYPYLKKTVRFSSKLPAFLDLRPAVQICFFKKKDIGIKSYSLVYPEYAADI